MDWELLATELTRQSRLPAAKVRATPLAGGDINRAFRVEIGSETCFVKTNHARLLPMFEAARRARRDKRQQSDSRARGLSNRLPGRRGLHRDGVHRAQRSRAA
jgi:hypothetical protein